MLFDRTKMSARKLSRTMDSDLINYLTNRLVSEFGGRRYHSGPEYPGLPSDLVTPRMVSAFLLEELLGLAAHESELLGGVTLSQLVEILTTRCLPQ